MRYQRELVLSPTERAQLIELRDHAPRTYLRERASALLKVADGTAAAVVARQRLLEPRRADTLYDWLNRFQAQGVTGLVIRPGRGRKPAFSPSAPQRRGRAARRAARVSARSARLRPGADALDAGGAAPGL